MTKSLWVLGVVALALAGCRTAEMRQPAQLEEAVRTNLNQATGLNAGNITVDVIDGVAVLSGTVPTQQDRQRAEEIARQTEGVTEVRNRLTVTGETGAPAATPGQPGATTGQPGTAGGPTSTDVEEPASETQQDTALRQRVQQQLQARDLEGADVRVQVNDGVVTLSGTVPSQEAADRAEAAARSVEGVQRVNNRLTVSPAGGTRTPGNQTGTTGSPQGQ